MNEKLLLLLSLFSKQSYLDGAVAEQLALEERVRTMSGLSTHCREEHGRYYDVYDAAQRLRQHEEETRRALRLAADNRREISRLLLEFFPETRPSGGQVQETLPGQGPSADISHYL